MSYIDDNSLGGQLKPVHDNHELHKAMLGRKDCVIYTVGTFKVNEENLFELKSKNIKLIGLAFAQIQFKPKKKQQQRKSNINIVVDELHEMPLNVSIGIDINKEQKKNYISGGMH